MSSSRNSDRPNLLVIITHDLGQHLGCYGAGLSTPNLDHLAAQGIRFDNYFCTAAQCSPSRGSILTGKYPHRNGLVGLAHIGWELNPGEKTLPACLNGAGYETCLLGVQHESADATTLGYGRVLNCGGKARQVTESFLDLAPHLADSQRPFYVCLGFVEPHRPFNQPEYNPDSPKKVSPLPYLPDRPGIREDLAGLNGMVYEVDRCVGKILHGLDVTGLRDNTLVIFTTDHGIAMPRAKGTCYEPGVKTALLLHLPGRFEGGLVRAELLSNVDLLPTLLEVAGADPPPGIDGCSFLPLLEDRAYKPRDHVFLEMTWHDRYNPMRGVRTQRHKYVRNFGDRPLVYLPCDIYTSRAGEEVRDEFYSSRRLEEELYDLETDPLETTNLASNPRYAQLLSDLRQRVRRWMEETDDRLLSGDWPPTELQRKREEEDKTPN